MTRLTARSRSGSRPSARRPEVEPLEDRLVPATNALANLNFAARVELDVLHHPLDGLGAALARRMDHGASRLSTIRSFEKTGAFKIALVGDAFTQVLGHGPDGAELTAGLRFLRHHKVLDLEVRLAGSDEFFVENGGTLDGFLAGLYRVGTGRAPNAAEQLLGDAALTGGESRTAFARGVMKSADGLAFQADTVFLDLLRHHAVGGELGQGAFLISRQGLEGLIAAVLSSGEYYHLSNVHATHLVFLGQPGTQTAGVAFGVAAAAEDDLGQLDVTFNGPVTVGLGANPAGGSLLGTQTQTATAGVVVFGPLTIQKAGGGYTVVVSTPGLRGAETGPFTVSPASADHLLFTTQPPKVATAGQGFTVRVTAEDPFGNVDTNYNGSVSLAIDPKHDPTGDTLHPAANPSVNASQGVATFTNQSVDKANDPARGHYALVATSGSLPAVTSATFDVTAAAASQLAFTTPPPGSVQSGQQFDVKVSAEDPFGNVDTTYVGRVTVSLTSEPAGGMLSGTTTQPVRMGVADFPDLSANKDGAYTMTASSGTLNPPAHDASFSVTAAPATQLVFNGGVPQSYAGSPLQGVTLLAEDSNGNVDGSYNGQVSVSLSGGASGAALHGTNPVNAQGGHITFTDLTINEGSPNNYVLDFSANLANGSATAQSNGFNVIGPGVSFTFTQPDINGNMTFTATVSPPSGNSPQPMGNVSFFVDGSATAAATTGNLNANGQASARLTLSPGNHTVRAQYNGDSNYAPVSTTQTLTFHDADDPVIDPRDDYDGDESFTAS